MPSLYSNEGLRRLIAGNVGYRQLQDAAVPIHLVAANMLTGEAVLLSTGNTVSAVLASAAIPAVFPAVERDGMMPQAVDLGAEEIYLLPAGYACALARPPRSALGSAIHALSLLLQRHVLLEVTYLAERVDLHVLPPLCPVSVSPLDFSQIPELIERGYGATSSWLAEGGDRLSHPERFLWFHDHGREHDLSDDAIGRPEMDGVESARVLPRIMVSLSLKAARLPVATPPDCWVRATTASGRRMSCSTASRRPSASSSMPPAPTLPKTYRTRPGDEPRPDARQVQLVRCKQQKKLTKNGCMEHDLRKYRIQGKISAA